MSPPWMPLYVADYISATEHLSAAESGAYLHLIMHYWQKGKLPSEDRFLSRIARMTDKEWSRSKGVIAEFFEENWRHSRIDEELEKANLKSEARADAGSRGGRSKALKLQEMALANDRNLLPSLLPDLPDDLLQQTASKTTAVALASSSDSTVDTKRHLSETDADAPPRTNRRKSYPDDFERFWSIFPTDPNMSKQEAGKVWHKLAAEDRQAAIASVPAFRSHCSRNPDYRTVHAVRYLAQRRFDGFAAQVAAITPTVAKPATAWTDEVLRKVAMGYLTAKEWPRAAMAEPGTEGSPVTSELLAEMRPEAQAMMRRMSANDHDDWRERA